MTLSAPPDYGATVPRQELVRLFTTRAPVLTIVTAPGGYGKSILAGQCAREPIFDAVHWVSFDGSLVTADDLLVRVGTSLTPQSVGTDTRVATTLPSAPLTRADAILSIRQSLRPLRHKTVCLIVDGLDVLDGVPELLELGRLLVECTSSSSRVIVTCRQLCGWDSRIRGDVWLVDDADLRFQWNEVVILAEIALGTSPSADVVSQLLECSGGQPALADLLARHPRLLRASWDGVPQDLLWYLESMVGALSDSEIRTLYAAALAGSGTAAEFEAINTFAPCDWHQLSRVVPLLSLTPHESGGPAGFRVHALLADVLSEIAAARLEPVEMSGLRERIYALLQTRGDYARIISILARQAETTERVTYCENLGLAFLRYVGPVALSHLLDLIPSSDVSARPKLLLLKAAVLRERASLQEALRSATLARALADCEDNWPLFVDASLLVARIALDLGDLSAVEAALSVLDADNSKPMATHSRCLVSAYLSVVDSQAGRVASAKRHATLVSELLQRLDPTSEAAVFGSNCLAAVYGLGMGKWRDVADVLHRLVSRRGLAPVQSLLLRSNHAAALLELGRLEQCELEIRRVLAEVDECGLEHLRLYVLDTIAGLEATFGNAERAKSAKDEATEMANVIGDVLAHVSSGGYWALCTRACGLADLSLAAAEAAVASAAHLEGHLGLSVGAAEVEIAASMLQLGDSKSAVERVERVRPLFKAAEANHHLLRADLVLAESERREGDFAAAVQRLAHHRDYILTESSNWQVGMYIRCFPGLLPVLARAIGVEHVPVHLLRVIQHGCADSALNEARKALRGDEYSALARRLEEGRRQVASTGEGSRVVDRLPTPCHVRLFGGLAVTTEYGEVPESAWSKRKARLLFAMLAVRRGQEIPRDVLLERLWPDMDEDRARNNFYVMWSAMKQALACGGKAELAAKYVANSGGLCRVTSLVRTDIDDFEEALKSLLASESAGHGDGVLAAAQEIAELYRGELLPGDLYEDWFTELRDRYRHDFCDSMLSAASAAERSGDYTRAVAFLRRALAADPWREDLYQAAMRCQMQAGQRSGAIETYFSCRAKLGEDLGIDPSFETQRLYENVLAMEETPPADEPHERAAEEHAN